MTVSYQEPKQKAEGSNRQPTADNRQPTKSGLVLGRNSLANSRWKRYAGGMVGELWIDAKGSGAFQRILKDLPGNPVRPQWVCNRIWFVSDHEGIGNLYSCNPDGSDLQPESFQQEYYVREPASDGRHVVFHVGGDLWRIDVQQPRSPKREQRINIQWATQRSRVQRRFFFGVDPPSVGNDPLRRYFFWNAELIPACDAVIGDVPMGHDDMAPLQGPVEGTGAGDQALARRS